MEIAQALKNSVTFPASSQQIEVIALERGLSLEGTFTRDIAHSREYLLSKADLMRLAATAPNVSEGGVSISFSEKKNLVNLANKIYSQFGEELIQDEQPKVEPLDW